MKAIFAIITAVIVTILSGCVVIQSVNPLFKQSEILFDSALIGDWSNGDSKDTVKISSKGDNEYDLKFISVENNVIKEDNLKGRMGKVGALTFLDIYYGIPKDYGFESLHQLSVHTFFKIKLEKDILKFQSFKTDTLAAGIESNRIAIDHVKISDEQIVLTAKSEDLQRQIILYDDSLNTYEKEVTLFRSK